MDNGVPSREAPLTLRQAAQRAGQDVLAFKALADGLNGAAEDLRVPGNRGAARYDPERLRRWLRDREGSEESTSTKTVQITASWDGVQWTVRHGETSVSATGPRLMAAQRSLADRLARVLPVGGGRILFDVVYEADRPATLAWAEAEFLKVQADELLNKAGRLRVEAIVGLMKEGMTPPEIAEVFGVSYQRIQQILANAKHK